MWDYESDAPSMWPAEQNAIRPPEEEMRSVSDVPSRTATPKARRRAACGATSTSCATSTTSTRGASDTQFADYHGHGWNFRAILKRDREGNLLDAEGNDRRARRSREIRARKARASSSRPAINPGKAVHLMDIHAEKGMQCADCHFAQDSHGNGLIYGEVANAIEIGCKDCHGTADAYPTLLHLRPGRAARGQQPRAAAQRGRPAALRMDRATTTAAGC